LTELQPVDELTPQEPTPGQEFKRFVVDIIETVLLALILFVVINLVSARVRVDGFSMRPTLEDGEFILVNKLAYKFAEPKRGEIIVFRSPVTPEDLIKRVIGRWQRIPCSCLAITAMIRRIRMPGDWCRWKM
jgi:signal peptidase I